MGTTAPPSEDFFRELFERLPEAVVLVDGDRRIVDANRAACDGFAPALADLFAEATEDGGALADFFGALDRSGSAVGECRLRDHAGNPRTVELDGTVLRGHIAMVVRDVTEQRTLEARIAQIQRVDSLGYHTASVVHDLSNLLMPILYVSESLSNELRQTPRIAELAEEIRFASERAVALVRRLNAPRPSKSNDPSRSSIAVVLSDMRALIQRAVGEGIEVVFALDPRCREVASDREELERVILNLVVNARDAMPESGRLTVESKLVRLEAHEARARRCSGPGSYAAITVEDTGVGMAPSVRRRLFERFFTTKPEGAGSGFGLAGAHRFVKRYGGCIDVESELGRGTTVTMYLPCEAS